MWFISKTQRSADSIVKLHKDYSNKKIVVTSKNAPPKKYNNDFITGFHHMFDGRMDIEEVIFEDDVDTSHITSVRDMFRNCRNLKRVVFPRNAFPKVIDVSYMFESCYKLEEVIAPGFLIEWKKGKPVLREGIHNAQPGLFHCCPISPEKCPIGLNMMRLKGLTSNP